MSVSEVRGRSDCAEGVGASETVLMTGGTSSDSAEGVGVVTVLMTGSHSDCAEGVGASETVLMTRGTSSDGAEGVGASETVLRLWA